MKRNYLNPPQIIMFSLMAVLLAAASAIDTSMAGIMNDVLIKWAMNGVIVLSLIPMINARAGRNFGMFIDLSAGLVDMIFSMNARHTSWVGFSYSMFLGMAAALLFDYLYIKILDHLKLSEEIVGIFAGYPFILAMNLFYTFAPVTNRQTSYPAGGQGPRLKVNLEPYFGQAPDRLWQARAGELVAPAGLLLFSFGTGFLLWLFSKTRAGVIFSAIAENERLVRLAGINVNGHRTAATIMSTVIVAAGMAVYSQGHEILHLYNGPFMMSLPTVSATVTGGASLRRAAMANALIGIFPYQITYLSSTPVANALLIPEIAEIMRTIITGGIILYASISKRKDMRNEAH